MKMDRVSLFEEFRLIERSESEVNGVWKGAHLLLFFMAFVFGSFCTFCFHMLMYLFDEKCVLFPKLQSLATLRHDVVYEFIPMDNELLPVDFLSSQWVEKSTCYLPTYVPLLSGIFGLVWTTMFLMCSTGSRTLTGLQRPWRILPPVFIFSLAMAGLCIYSSAVTHSGLQELCLKLGEITGSATCTYTVNVATLAYERRIRGVYQAIRLTITSAWLHTMCWLLSAAVALARVLLAVDFQLVRVRVEFVGDIDKMLEHQEAHIHTVSPDILFQNENKSETSLRMPVHSPSKVHFTDTSIHATEEDIEEAFDSDVLYVSKVVESRSERYLISGGNNSSASVDASLMLSNDLQFIVEILNNLVLTMELPDDEPEFSSSISDESVYTGSQIIPIVRQIGRENINRQFLFKSAFGKAQPTLLMEPEEAEKTAKEMRKYLKEKLHGVSETSTLTSSDSVSQISFNEKLTSAYESELNITDELRDILQANKNWKLNASDNGDQNSEEKVIKKSNWKHVSIQTNETDREQHYASTSNSQNIRMDVPDDQARQTNAKR